MTHPTRLSGPIALLFLGSGIIPPAALGQAPQTAGTSVTGTWEIRVETRGRLGRPEVITLRQNADGSLSGAFVVESRRSEEPIAEGRIAGNSVAFARENLGAE